MKYYKTSIALFMAKISFVNEEQRCYAEALPGELWLLVFRNFHPIYEDLFTLSRICKQWQRLIVLNPDPSLWERLDVANIRKCKSNSLFLFRFRTILSRFGQCVKFLRVHKCHELFADSLLQFAPNLSSLQYFEISDTTWNKHLLREFGCFKSLTTIIIEAAELVNDEQILEEDLYLLADNFAHLATLGLRYSTLKSESLNALKDLVASRHGKNITNLHLERSRMESSDIDDIVKMLPSLKKFSYGNDQIYGLPSFQNLILDSNSLVEVELYQIGDIAEFYFSLPAVKKLTLNGCTSAINLDISASALRVLHLSRCVELRKLKRISASSLRELKVRKCNVLSLAEFLSFLVKNPDVKTLELEVCWTSLRLDRHSSPSLEELSVHGTGDFLMAIDVRCPKLQSFHFQRAAFRSTVLKAVAVLGEIVKDISIHNVPHLRRVNIDVEEVYHLEIDFDRRAGQIKPGDFTKLKLRSSGVKVTELVLKSFNLGSLVLSSCKVNHVVLENCNLDCPISTLINQCGQVQILTLRGCYGPCQLDLSNQHLKEVHIDACAPLLMEHINLSCPSIELLNVTGCSFLPNLNELSTFAGKVRELCPLLHSVDFSQ